MEKNYQLFTQQMDALLEGETDTIANLSNVASLLYHSLEHVNWVGFYLYKNGELVLGPFQGKVACTRIPLDRGVCGKAATTREIQCVGDVHEFPGHIACDCTSNSELVVPIIIDGELFGVLDIDSDQYNNFDEIDTAYVSRFVNRLKKHIYI